MLKHRVLIGGIGDDAHSVGIGLIALGFREAGFYVHNLGIRNSIDAFFDHAFHFDVIMISNKNGHAEFYLEKFGHLFHAYKLRDDSPKLWYIGGSLSVSESDFAIKKRFLALGFSDVYPRPVPFTQILENIKRDLERLDIKKKDVESNERRFTRSIPIDVGNICNRKWLRSELNQLRKDILREYETGTEVYAEHYEADQNPSKSLDKLLWLNKVNARKPLFQPRTGVADINQQIILSQHLEEAGGDVSSVQLDAASRSKLYEKAKLGLELSHERKTSQLNGFPIPIYGVKKVRQLLRSLKNPFQLRAGGPDHRFTYEIALKAGVTGLEGGFICYLLPYDKFTSPTQSLYNWQYVDRLCSTYAEDYGVEINREYFGVLTATLIEPSLAIAVNIIQAILSAQQGIKSVSVGYAEQGNRMQDIAAIQVMQEMVRKYLFYFKFYDCRVTSVFHQFMAAFPSDYRKAEELILNSSISATLAGATKVMVKTAAEAIRIPDKYDNAKAIMLSKRGAAIADFASLNPVQLKFEKDLIREEVESIVKTVIELGNGSIAFGAIKAIECGILDVPWSPNIYNHGKVVTVRDTDGAVRFNDFGNLPFTEKIKSFHKERVHIRKTMERDSSLFSLLEKDLSRIWQNDYKQWPLDGSYVN